MATRVPALIQLSDPRVAAQLVDTMIATYANCATFLQCSAALLMIMIEILSALSQVCAVLVERPPFLANLNIYGTFASITYLTYNITIF